MNSKQTSWGGVADWYDGLVKDPDSYQKNVIMPNIIRIVDPEKGMTILDIACGQGYFARAFVQNQATVIAADISQELIRIAKVEQDKYHADEKNMKVPMIDYHVAPADALPFVASQSVDVVTIVLALQNIEAMQAVMAEASRVLKVGGRFIIVINHPAFRIPQKSDWGWNEKISKQFRMIYSYMSDDTVTIDMTPGEKRAYLKKTTVSFHRPLQSYFKAFAKSGFAVTRLEEWISHKKSQNGPRAVEEDRSRKEIPMFVCIEAKKLA